MQQSTRAQEFLRSLDPEGLKVGDGSDRLPVWVGIDAEAGKVYKVYANGFASGFGDGLMQIRVGLGGRSFQPVEQLTTGKHTMLCTGEGKELRMILFEARN